MVCLNPNGVEESLSHTALLNYEKQELYFQHIRRRLSMLVVRDTESEDAVKALNDTIMGGISDGLMPQDVTRRVIEFFFPGFDMLRHEDETVDMVDDLTDGPYKYLTQARYNKTVRHYYLARSESISPMSCGHVWSPTRGLIRLYDYSLLNGQGEIEIPEYDWVHYKEDRGRRKEYILAQYVESFNEQFIEIFPMYFYETDGSWESVYDYALKKFINTWIIQERVGDLSEEYGSTFKRLAIDVLKYVAAYCYRLGDHAPDWHVVLDTVANMDIPEVYVELADYLAPIIGEGNDNRFDL